MMAFTRKQILENIRSWRQCIVEWFMNALIKSKSIYKSNLVYDYFSSIGIDAVRILYIEYITSFVEISRALWSVVVSLFCGCNASVAKTPNWWRNVGTTF